MGQKHINEFKRFAGNLLLRYSSHIPQEVRQDKHKLMMTLDMAMHKMQNELNGKAADIMAAAAYSPGLNEEILEQGLVEISRSSIKELLKRNF